jgi:hypothetical protein
MAAACNISEDVRLSPSNLFNPLIVAAPSLLPPPSPANTGIFFFRIIFIPLLYPEISLISFAALYIRLFSSHGKLLSGQLIVIPLSVFSKINSSAREIV